MKKPPPGWLAGAGQKEAKSESNLHFISFRAFLQTRPPAADVVADIAARRDPYRRCLSMWCGRDEL